MEAPTSGSILYPLPESEEIPRRDMLGWEKELVGVYVSEHPMQQALSEIKDKVTCFLGQIDETMVGKKVTLAGMINSVRQIYTKNGKPMAFVEIEDSQCAIEIIVFPRVYEQSIDLWQEGKVVVVRGKVDNKDGQKPKVICDSVDDSFATARPASSAEDQNYHQNPEFSVTAMRETPSPLHVNICLNPTGDPSGDRDRVRQVYRVMSQFEGADTFSFSFVHSGQRCRMDFPNATTHHCVELEQQIGQLLGASAYQAVSRGGQRNT